MLYIILGKCHGFQAVYLKRGSTVQDISVSSEAPDFKTISNPLDSIDDKTDLLVAINEDADDEDDSDTDDSDPAKGFSSFQNILKDVIPGVKVKVMKVTAPEKVDKDLISKVIEQIIEEDDEEQDDDIDNLEIDDEDESESEGERESESDGESDLIELDVGPEIVESKEQSKIAEDKELSEIAFKVVVGGLMQKMSSGLPTKNVNRVPAKLEKNGRLSFAFSIEKDASQHDSHDKEQALMDKKSLKGRRSIDHVMYDLTKFIGKKEKVPLKVSLHVH